jgi:uncharacterized membrane protein YfcA
MVGAGGGFLLTPVMLLLYRDDPPELITRISLTIVFLNGVVGSIVYGRQKRIDYRTALLLAPTVIPGAIVGALATRGIDRDRFALLFGIFLLLEAFLLTRLKERIRQRRGRRGEVVRELRDSEGSLFRYSYKPLIALTVGFGAGFLSSLFGIGGGIIQVPSFVFLLNFPMHIAVATSQFMLTLTGLAGASTHFGAGDLSEGWRRTGLLAVGVLIGSPVGARLAKRLPSDRLRQMLSLILAVVGLSVIALR